VTASAHQQGNPVSAEDIAHFETHGYVVLRNVVPAALCAAVIDSIWAFTGYSPDRPEDWDKPPRGMDARWPQQDIGMLPLFHHQALWDVRQHPAVHAAFAAILGQPELWVSIDRVSFKPPFVTDAAYFAKRGVHWDIDTSAVTFPLPRPRPVQGLVMLAETAENQGGFHCIPSIFESFEAWLAAQPPDRDPWQLDPKGYDVVTVTGGPGDLVIWDSLLLHGNGVNRTPDPRFAQYVTMMPADPAQSRAAEIESWRTGTAPSWAPGDPRGWERQQAPATLTPLGRRLLGTEPWA